MQETYVEQFRRILDAKKAWNEEDHGTGLLLHQIIDLADVVHARMSAPSLTAYLP